MERKANGISDKLRQAEQNNLNELSKLQKRASEHLVKVEFTVAIQKEKKE